MDRSMGAQLCPSTHDGTYLAHVARRRCADSHSLNGANPGHLIWDDFYLYTPDHVSH
jgi:hypothetical protein